MPMVFQKYVHPPQERHEETPSRPVSIVPYPRNPDFVGRDTLLNQLHRRGDVPGSRIALIGPGGVGKTQLAAEYTYSIRDRSPETSVFWVPARDAGRFERGCRDIANRLKIPGRQNPKANICELLHAWLQDERNGKWVLVFDNLDDGEFLRNIRPADVDDLGVNSSGLPGKSFWSYFCEGLKGPIVITTRNGGVTSMVEDSNVLHVAPMNNDQAIALFEKKCSVQADREEVIQLVTALDFMPLAITQAAAYINRESPNLSVPRYLELIPGYNKVSTTWQLLFNHVRDMQPSAADLLCVMSFFDADGIPGHVFRQNGTGLNIRDLPTYDKDRANNGGDGEASASEPSGLDILENDISLLEKYSMISVSADGSKFGMHRLVQRTTQNWLKDNGQFEEYKERFIRILWSNFPAGRLRNSSRCESLFAHVLCAAAQRPNAEASLGQWASLLHEAASFAMTRGTYADSTKLAGEAFSTRTKLFGVKDEQTLNSSQVLALSYSLEGRWNEAQELQEHVMETSKQVLGSEHPFTLTTASHLASTYSHQGQLKEAEELLTLVMNTSKQLLEPERSGPLPTMTAVISSHWNQTQIKEAEELLTLVVQTSKHVLGPEHPNALLSMDNLASLYMSQGNWTAAKQLLMQVIQIRRQVLGPEHPSTLLGMDNLASLYMSQEEWTATEQLLLQVIEIRKQALGPDHLDTLQSMNNLTSVYVLQGECKVAKEHLIQVIGTSMHELGSDYANTRIRKDIETRVMNTHDEVLELKHSRPLLTMNMLAYQRMNEGQWEEAKELQMQMVVILDSLIETREEGSDSATENDSVFSASVSHPSATSLESRGREINSLLVREFATLLFDDGTLFSLLLVGISEQRIGFERMRNNFRRLLKHFANNLKVDIHSELHQNFRRFVSSYSRMITQELFAMTPIGREHVTRLLVPEAVDGTASVKDRAVREKRVENYLQSLRGTGPFLPTNEATTVLNRDDEDSDQDSVAEEAGEDEPYEGSLPQLDQVKSFILESVAYQMFRRRLQEFVHPSLYSRLRDLVTQWTDQDDRRCGDTVRYNLHNLVSDLQHVNPLEVRFDIGHGSSRFVKFISPYQYLVERWTGEHWDWWPFPPCQRPLEESETRLRWKCECGEERWAEVPKTFAKRLQSIIRSLPTGTTACEDLQPPPVTQIRSDSLPSSASNNEISNQAPHQGHGIKQALGSSSDPSIHHRLPGPQTSNFDMSLTQHRVLLVVKSGHNYRLAQIRVSSSNHNTFFGTLREEYFRLRGMMRSWFSVWRYNHCEFYEFEKFDDHLFAPKTKNAFPSHRNTEYEYLPRPIDNIPPISEHAFWCKFYACHKPRPYHLHHKCNQRRSHSNEMLKSLPKKKTELEEGGDKREYFWGIYACENISIRWIIFYNFLCVSPLLAFFVARIIPQGHGTDLQNPSIPLSMMCSMLSLFWSVYLSSLQFGRSH